MPGDLRAALKEYQRADEAVTAAGDAFYFAVPHWGPEWAICVVRGDPAAAAKVAGEANLRHGKWRVRAAEARKAADTAAICARAPETRTALSEAADQRLRMLDGHLCSVATNDTDYREHPDVLARDRGRAEELRRGLVKAEALLRWANWAAGQRAEDPLPRQTGNGAAIWPSNRLSQRANTGLSRLWAPTPATTRGGF